MAMSVRAEHKASISNDISELSQKHSTPKHPITPRKALGENDSVTNQAWGAQVSSEATHEVHSGNRVEVGLAPLVSASYRRVLSAQNLK